MANAIRALKTMDKARAHSLLPPHLKPYMEDARVLAGSLYPEEDMLEVNRALAQIMHSAAPNRSMAEIYVEMGRLVGRIDLAGVYASLLTSDPHEMVTRMAGSWKQYHDTGSMRVLSSTSSATEVPHIELIDFPHKMQELCWIQKGWFTAYLQLAGGRDIDVREVQCRCRGAVSCSWEIRWV